MKLLVMCSVFILGLSGCSHFGKKCCDKSSCTMEHKEHCDKDSKDCAHGECEMKK